MGLSLLEDRKKGGNGFEFFRSCMTREQLVAKIRELLKTVFELKFLLRLKMEEIEILIACVRDRVDQVGD